MSLTLKEAKHLVWLPKQQLFVNSIQRKGHITVNGKTHSFNDELVTLVEVKKDFTVVAGNYTATGNGDLEVDDDAKEYLVNQYKSIYGLV